jgi:hypothetical protein
MLSGPPLPLPRDIPLHQLLACARHPGTLGAWVCGSVRTLHVYEVGGRGAHRLLIAPDLGHLLSRCNWIVLREGDHALLLEASAIIQWRSLQVVTATPFLPCPERLSQLFPGAQVEAAGFLVPLSNRAPEPVLSDCVRHGIAVRMSQIVYSPTHQS